MRSVLASLLLLSPACVPSPPAIDLRDVGARAVDSGDAMAAAHDAGDPPDSALVDSGVLADAGVLADTGALVDTGLSSDAAPLPDAAEPADAGPAPDATEPADLGPRDSGPPHDAGPLTALEQSLVDLPADSWLRVGTGFGGVCDDNGEWHAVSGCSGLTAFSGGLYDPEHRWMLIWGGGHNDYAGNEVYAFKLGDFSWERLTTPSLGPYNRDPLADGQPVSRHTYDGLTWIGDQHVMWAWGGARANDGNGTNEIWVFDPSQRQWANTTQPGTPGSAYESSALWDPVSGLIYLKAGEHFRTYDPRTRVWAEPHNFGFPPLWPRYAGGHQRATLDTRRRLIWFIGGDLYMIYDIAADRFVTDDWITTGGGQFDNAAAIGGHTEQRIVTGGAAVIQAADPGLDYDIRADQLVSWTGQALWVLDMTTKAWTQKPAPGGPVQAGGASIYGRFRYVEALNVFILVPNPSEVWFYKNSAGP